MMSAAPQTLAREVFTTSRLAEFCTRRELEKQTGHSADGWPIYVAKELLDNALDSGEESGIAPKVEITIATDRITVADNGPGIAAQTVERLLDLGRRTSARAHYVSPTRGAQGQALSTLLVMPHALDPEGGCGVIIESHGLAHRIAVRVNKLSGEPSLIREVSDSQVKNGTKITVEWPQSACSILEEGGSGFLPLAGSYTLSNPHLSLSVHTPRDEPVTFRAAEPAWTKWRACDPTSPHWYTREAFGKLVAAYVQKDQETGRRRPLREFLEQFDGLSSTTKRGRILADTGLQPRAVLNDLLLEDGLDPVAVARLLGAMQAETKPIKPERLGIIGEASLRHRIKGNSFKYARAAGVDAGGLPYVVEGAFTWHSEQGTRFLFTGANFASSPSLSFKVSLWESARQVLEQRHAGTRESVTVFLHVTHPRLTFTDLGKTQLSLPPAVAKDLRTVIEKITGAWDKQRTREEKDHRAELKRQDALERVETRKMTIKESVYRHLPAAYEKASGGYGARSRQIFYQLRPLVLADTGRESLDSQYIMQSLIPDFIAENPEICARWTVYYDDRGHLIEPHTKKIVGLGTKNVREYCHEWRRSMVSGLELSPPDVSTRGPQGRYGAILFCEKEGFTELFQTAKLPEKYDIALASTKGTSVTAARELFEKAASRGVPIFCLHDFDYNGFEIAATLHQDTRRYQFKQRPHVIDIGLRLGDVKRLDLQSEPVAFDKSADALRENLQEYGAKDDEIAFLIGGRVELNAMTTPQLLELVETAFAEHGIEKVVPGDDKLAGAYRAWVEYRRAQDAIEEQIRKVRDELGEGPVPDDLADRVAAYLAENPTEPWETAVETLAGEQAR